MILLHIYNLKGVYCRDAFKTKLIRTTSSIRRITYG